MTHFLAKSIVMSLLGFSSAVFGDEYSSGHGALETFNVQGFIASPFVMKVWLIALISCFAIGIFFIRTHVIARWTTGGFIFSALTGHLIFRMLDLPFLDGSFSIMHLLYWTLGLLLLLIKHPFLDDRETPFFRSWSACMTLCILISFAFDIREAAIYTHHVISINA